jgi:putative SOS response-associated peptidase YedK
LGDELVAHFRLAERYQPRPRYNVAPSQEVMAGGLRQDGRRAARGFRWGLVPRWASDTKKAPINARSETVEHLPTFAEAFHKWCCLLPADGFYEWRALPGRRKQPWAFPLASGSLFAFAGIWECWRQPDEPPLFTCALLTTSANEVVPPVHGRMPVILGPGDYGAWLDPRPTPRGCGSCSGPSPPTL